VTQCDWLQQYCLINIC